ncbi:MAG: hypothetical protein SGBAC_010131, partial [Bacillariaceae sp.]
MRQAARRKRKKEARNEDAEDQFEVGVLPASGQLTIAMQVATTEQVVEPSSITTALQLTDPTSVQSLLHRVSRNYAREATPPSNRFRSILHPHQRQSLAFMKDVEALPGNDFGGTIKGGWLASEVGMGVLFLFFPFSRFVSFRAAVAYPAWQQKTAIILALIASDAAVSSKGWLCPKATVVLTSASLLGQWEDEVKKHAPYLSIGRFHPSSKSRNPIDLRYCKGRDQLPDVDILISTATFEWPDYIAKSVKFHRVVMDEAHLLSNTATANIRYANRIKSDRRWCVTATPFGSSISDLEYQIQFLGIQDGSALGRAFVAHNVDDEKSLDAFAAIFAKHVTRHEKSQIMDDGRKAMELPNKVYKVVSLKMSPEEQSKYQTNIQRLNWTKIRTFERNGASPHLWALESNIRAVVYTQYRNTHAQVVKALKALF